jgi:hypothetical protein
MSPTVGVGAVAGAGDVEDAIVVVDGGGGGLGALLSPAPYPSH